MEFRALGPLEVRRDGAMVDLGPPKQRALLALLLINAGQVVAADRILDELWGPDAAGKENALWVLVSRLRSVLEPGRSGRGDSTVLLTRGSGYVLSLRPEMYDVARFDDLVEQGRASLADAPGQASHLLAEGLGLWRGSAFDDVRYEEFAQAEVARLDEARIGALEDRIDADLACGRDGELVSELEAVRQQHPLRERPVAQLMLALYRSGRPADALRSFDRFRRALAEETGLDPSPSLGRLEEQILLHDERLRRPMREGRVSAPLAEVENPFKGLRPFVEEDADDFFGRDRLVAEILRVIHGGQRLVTVVGASGVGKSSVVQAGLIPALRKDAIAGSSGWLVAHMVPGSHPFAELEAALLRSCFDAPPSLAEQLDDPDAGVLRAVLRVLPDSSSRVVLVIDQLEELFALVDEPARTRFLDNLVVALDDPHRRLTVVATLRADFYGNALAHPALGARLGGGLVNVTPLTSEELEAAASEPAARVGVTYEPALLAQVIADVGREPGALPLFQFTLTDLFDRRVGDQLLISTYRSMGGVTGALERRTAALFDDLSADEQRAAKQIFLRMVAVTETGERARRRVSAGEILSLGVEPVAIQAAIDVFGRHRLLTFDADPLTGAPTVEVAHEALLTSWPQLAAWIDDSRDDLRRHRSFTVALREWELSNEDHDYLLTGARLAEYEQWATSSSMRLTAPERRFLDESAQLAAERERREQARRSHEETLDRRARRRLWSFGAAALALLAVGAVLIVAWVTRSTPPRVGLFAHSTDDSYGANIAAGLERARREYDFELESVALMINPDEQFRELAESNPDLIITDQNPVLSQSSVFRDFPKVRFGIIDIALDEPNAASITFANEQGSYLVGIAAALKSQTGVVGFVGGLPVPYLEEFRAGFEAGAKSVKPDIEVLATYIEAPLYGDYTYLLNAWNREDLAQQRATALYQQGADVVFHAAGQAGFGVFRAAVEQSQATGDHLWAIGVDNDQWFQVTPEVQQHLLTSMIKRADVAAYLLTKQFLDGHFQPGVQELGLADDALGYSTQGSGMTPPIIDELERAKSDIVSERTKVPTVPTGVLLQLDPLPNGFDDAIAAIPPDRLLEYTQWLGANYTAEFDTGCYRGSRATCGQLILDHLHDWPALSR
jgi:basic membrane lipoprotein Med (substrate-binding protein (PBP1-ABC) superfamily)/DNA-binding SARP family transcriptional activator